VTQQAAPKTKSPQTISVLATAATDQIRNEQFLGNDFMVVPVVALVEGVWHSASSEHPELALASEFGSVPEGWNGRPVTLGHPKREGSFVSAGSPDVYNKEVVGILFNTRVEDKKLKTEAWIDKEKVDSLGEEAQKEIDRLLSGQVVEVSTGLFANVDDASGYFNGEEFDGIWRNVVPDHLALLAEGSIGACSVADGAGAPRLNQIRTLSKNPKEGQMPKERENIGAVALQKLRSFSGTIWSRLKSQLSSSNVNVENALNAALALADAENCYYIVAIFDDSFVYIRNWENLFYQQAYTINDSGTVILGTTVTAVRPVTEFVPIDVQFEGGSTMTVQERVTALLQKNKKLQESDRVWLEKLEEAQLEKLLQDPPQEKEGEEGATEPAKEPAEPKPPEEPKEKEANGEEEDVGEEDADEEEEPTTLEAFLKKAPKELKEVLNEGVRMHKDAKNKLVESLKANKRCDFSEKELQTMGLKELTRLAKLAKVPNYMGNASASVVAANETPEETYVPAPAVFARKAVGAQ